MKPFTHIQHLLYEYIRGEISQDEQSEIENHLVVCPRCRLVHQRMTETMQVLDRATPQPSDQRPPEFWNSFAARVEERLTKAERTNNRATTTFSDGLQWFGGMRWRTAFAIAGGFAALTAAFLLLQGRPTPPAEQRTASTDRVVSGTEQVDKRMTQYLRKSHTLLVGLTNMKASPGTPVDIDAERQASRSLVNEARILKHQPLDPRSARLVGDLERIFIELANTEPGKRVGDIDIIRNGIHQENLLFKVRMAQARYDPAQGK
jgi:hypothetical protein